MKEHNITWIPLDKVGFKEVTLTEDIAGKQTVEYVSMENKTERYISFDGINWQKDKSFLEVICETFPSCEKCEYKFECWTENNGLKEKKNA